jgi:prepilin-type N-terminal cleavage/methylation domain-containing protein/prepilin-type processing-associated H-X9-DG protein
MVRANIAKHAGFTLIETLVVIAILGVLVGILVPAVMKMRVSAARVECQNNFRQTALATQHYVSAQGGFPPLVAYSLGWKKKGSPSGSIHFWTAYLLPYLDQNTLTDKYDFDQPFFANTAVIATPVKVFQCPATPERDRVAVVSQWTPSHAFGVKALAVVDKFLKSSGPVKMAASDVGSYNKVSNEWKLALGYPSDAPDLVGVMAAAPYLTKTQVRELLAGGTIPLQFPLTRPGDVTDGLSNSVLVVECAGGPQKWQAGQLVDPGDDAVGAGWADPGAAFTIRGDINASCLMNCSNKDAIYSFHPGGANFAFADGSARFLSSNISLRTLVALLTAKSGDVPGNDW